MVAQAQRQWGGAVVGDNRIVSSWLDVLLPFVTVFVVTERQHAVLLFLGAYTATITRPGVYVRSALVTKRFVGTDLRTIELPEIRTADLQGCGVIVSAVVTFQITDARRAAIDVRDPVEFVRCQAPAVLKVRLWVPHTLMRVADIRAGC